MASGIAAMVIVVKAMTGAVGGELRIVQDEAPSAWRRFMIAQFSASRDLMVLGSAAYLQQCLRGFRSRQPRGRHTGVPFDQASDEITAAKADRGLSKPDRT